MSPSFERDPSSTVRDLLRLCLPLTVAAMLLLLGLGLAAAQGPVKLTRVTSASDSDRDSYSPSISGDGTRVAFESDSDFLGQGIITGQLEIWLYDTATMTVTRVTTASGDGLRRSGNASVSDDGTVVAFHSSSDFLGQGIDDGQMEIWLYDTATMTVTRVTTSSDGANRDSYYPSLSADGTVVAFASDSELLGPSIANGQYEIWLYDTATMTVTRVTTSSDGDNRYSMRASLSDDGNRVAFYSDSDFLGQGIDDEQFEIWLYDTATMTVTRVTTAAGSVNRDSWYPSLSGDGTKIAFESDSDFLSQSIPDGQYEIWLWEYLPGVYLPVVLRSGS